MITTKHLQELGACAASVRWFAALFPQGASVPDAIAAVPPERTEWLVWYAARTARPAERSTLAFAIARLAFREAGHLNPALAPFAGTLGPDNWRAAYAAYAAYAANAAAAAYAANAIAANAANAVAAVADARQRIDGEIRALAIAALMEAR